MVAQEAVTGTREFQGTIAAQLRVEADSDWSAHYKLGELARYMRENGITVDQWTVPLVRDIANDTADAQTFTVLAAIEVAASTEGTAACAGYEVVSLATEALSANDHELHTETDELEYQKNRLADAEAQKVAAQENIDYRTKNVARIEQRIAALVADREGRMAQGVVTSYSVMSVTPGDLASVTASSQPGGDGASEQKEG